MAEDSGTVTVQILARWEGKEYDIGVLTLDADKVPTADEIVALIHEGTR